MQDDPPKLKCLLRENILQLINIEYIIFPFLGLYSLKPMKKIHIFFPQMVLVILSLLNMHVLDFCVVCCSISSLLFFTVFNWWIGTHFIFESSS